MIDSKAKWIWPKDDVSHHSTVKFRKHFNYNDEKNVIINITADSRYYLYINSQYVNYGPVRAYPAHYKYDSIDITPFLKKGKNTLNIIVQHYGQSNFQYILANRGLLLSISGLKEEVVSNHTFLGKKAEEYLSNTPEICVQQPFEEQVDARLSDDFLSDDYDDSQWQECDEYDDTTHQDLTEREIPLLTNQVMNPVRLVSAESVKSIDNIISFNLRPYLTKNLTYEHSCYVCDGVVVIEATCNKPGKFNIKYNNISQDVYLNGEKIDTAGTTVENNIFTFFLPTYNHNTQMLFCFDGYKVDIKSIRLYLFDVDNKKANESNGMGFFNIVQPNCTIKDKNILKTQVLKEQGVDISEVCNSVNVFGLCYCEKVLNQVKIKDDYNLTAGNGYAVIEPREDDTRILLDYGQELVGFFEFEVFSHTGGDILDFHGFEFIQPDGRYNFAEGMNNTMRYITKKGYNKYRSLIRHGLRYCYISFRNISQPLYIKAPKLIFSTYPQSYKGSFYCSDEMVNNIYKAGKDTLRCCSEDTYTDCPTYEQTHWVGDARNEALIDWVVNGDYRLWYRCLEQTGQSLDFSIITQSQVPSGWFNIIPTWSFLWMQSICEFYKYTGQKQLTEKLFLMLKKNIEGIKKCINKDGLFELKAWNMFDWADMDTPADAVVTHQNCTLVRALNQSANLAKELGYEKTAKDWSELANKIKQAINQYMWNEQKQAYTDCLKNGVQSSVFSQQTNTVAVLSGVAEGARLSRCQEIINDPQDFVKGGSPFFEFFLLESIMNNQDNKRFIELIKNDWGFMIQKGCNTFWEMWTYIQPDGRLTRSHCHGWSAAPTYMLTEYVLGVRPLEPGYKKALINPHPCNLEWCRGDVPTPYGIIHVEWKVQNGKLELNYSAPKEITVEVKI
ncbi:MAG TPA: family 78 glycoside hydrolase catalytic domain [Clostridia bacterium]